MTDEDLVAAKLKGYACLIKFKDGEELLIKAPEVLTGNSDEASQWFMDAEKFINGCTDDVVEYFPVGGFAMSKDSIKYIKQI